MLTDSARVASVVGEVGDDTLGAHAERCGNKFRIERVDEVGEPGDAQRAHSDVAGVERVGEIGAGAGARRAFVARVTSMCGFWVRVADRCARQRSSARQVAGSSGTIPGRS